MSYVGRMYSLYLANHWCTIVSVRLKEKAKLFIDEERKEKEAKKGAKVKAGFKDHNADWLKPAKSNGTKKKANLLPEESEEDDDDVSI